MMCYITTGEGHLGKEYNRHSIHGPKTDDDDETIGHARPIRQTLVCNKRYDNRTNNTGQARTLTNNRITEQH